MTAPVTEERLREAARRTLEAVPGATAVMLYGSRARGTAHPDSDWDVAVITRGKGGIQYPLLPIERQLPGVAAMLVPRSVLREKRNCMGHVAREILLDGRVLAGLYPVVGSIERSPPMQPEEFKLKANAVTAAVVGAGEAFRKVVHESPSEALGGFATAFVSGTADAAEHLAKLMMLRRGVSPPHWHDLSALADSLERDDAEGRWTDEVKRIRAMNGKTRLHHQAAYTGIGSADVSCAITRLPLVCAYFVDECAAAQEDPALEAAVGNRLTAFRSDLGTVAGELENASPAPVESAETIYSIYVGEGIGEEFALREAQEAAAAARALREAIPVFRDLFAGLTTAPRSPGERPRRAPDSQP